MGLCAWLVLVVAWHRSHSMASALGEPRVGSGGDHPQERQLVLCLYGDRTHLYIGCWLDWSNRHRYVWRLRVEFTSPFDVGAGDQGIMLWLGTSLRMLYL